MVAEMIPFFKKKITQVLLIIINIELFFLAPSETSADGMGKKWARIK